MPTPSRSGRSRTRPAAPEFSEPEAVIETLPEPESTPEETVTEISNEQDVEAEDDGTSGHGKPGRKPMSQVERQKRADYRACQKAKELLEKHGFSVTAPASWEDPDVERKRDNARKVLAELQAAGVDVSALLSEQAGNTED